MTKFIGTQEQLINALTELSTRGNQTQEFICLAAINEIERLQDDLDVMTTVKNWFSKGYLRIPIRIRDYYHT